MTESEKLMGLDVSRETYDRLRLYIKLLEKWNGSINLVAKSTIGDAWNRHILDSLQLFKHSPAGAHWVDLGSGAGFPGLVIAIVARDWRPGLGITLIESDQRKVAFLSEAARCTETMVKIINRRSEDAEPLNADILSARAFAPLNKMMPHIARHMHHDGAALLLKGARHAEEVALARESWNFVCETFASQTDSDAAILKIKGVTRV